MGQKQGAYLGGIRTIEDIRKRCRVDSDTGCWHWALCLMEGRTPRLFYVGPEPGAKGISTTGRRAAAHLSRGKPLQRDEVVFPVPTCRSPDCVNPRHFIIGTKKDEGSMLKKSGRLKGNPRNIAANRRIVRVRAKLTPEMREIIKTSTESSTALGKRFGVRPNTVWECRIGRTWQETAAGASVFTWGRS